MHRSMNFMANSSHGFYGEEDQNMTGGRLPFSSNSFYSTATASPSFHHHHQRQQHERGNLDLMAASPVVGNSSNDDDAGAAADDENDVVIRLADSSSLGPGGGGGGGGGAEVVEREHMFDKVVTPSDVGKLNRLVIPKQHAEKYFPLDSSSNEKGLLLNFEDRNGKPWRFRYSYWNSSQSYVMTKGWSRFVKEKKLDAGDIVSFQRGVGDLGRDRLFIDWRRRPEVNPPAPIPLLPQHYLSFHRSPSAWSTPATPLFLQPAATASRDFSHFHQQHGHPNSVSSSSDYHQAQYGYSYGSSGTGHYGYNNNNNSSASHVMHPCSSPLIYFRSAAAPQQLQPAAGLVQLQSTTGSMGGGSGGGSGGAVLEPIVFESVPVVQGKAAAKRLRLFGVNMDCPASEESDDQECQLLSSAATSTIPYGSTVTAMARPQYSPNPPPYLSSSSSPLQLKLYNGSPLPPMHPYKGKPSSSTKSFDLDI